ncbi:MAG: C-terminal binding protein [Anaerolineales bacterium]|jgi:D-3-phosphoglycerate dehydrogenase
MKMEIVVIDPGYDSYVYEKRLFEENGFEFKVFDGGHHDREGKIAFASKAVGALLRWTQVDDTFLGKLPELKAIVRYGVGYENFDFEATKLHGVRVANVQSYANQAVSDHALALLMSCSRRLSFRQHTLKDNFGKPPTTDVIELSNKTLGIVGLGRIGGTFCRKVQPLFERVLAVDPYIPPERIESLGAKKCDLQTLLRESDAISVHCNLTPETQNLFDEKAFAMMARRPILVNTARGPVVNAVALLDALYKDIVHSAGLDVYPEEPPGDVLEPLLSHPRVIATGHYAWYSIKSSEELQKRAANNLLALLRGDEVEDELPEKKRYL